VEAAIEIKIKTINKFQTEYLDMMTSKISSKIAKGEKYIQCLFFTRKLEKSDLPAINKHEISKNTLA
tara:strand:+ start:1812 stop:2012 length:201 start_codon:yes stop_codon:yes gene_type:complete